MARAALTENGWPSVWRESCETIQIPGTEARVELLRGDVAVILAGWAAWWNRNVRPVVPLDGHRNWWGHDNSSGNAVSDSNHYSGTAIDLDADELPWTLFTMPQNQIDIVERGLTLFEGLLYWGGHWNRVDQMHTQMDGGTFNNPRVADFANRLRNGYLGLFGPPDPNAFPLPGGYYYGPLEGPIESISGEYVSDSQVAKDGLGRWQEALGLPVTKRWNDGKTPQAATTLQKAKGWPPNPAFGYGGVYQGEWDAVIREGWRLPAGWDSGDVAPPEIPLTKWGDYSQYQGALLDDTYPHPVISFRCSVADANRSDSGSPTGKAGLDAKWLANSERARNLIGAGKLKKVIAYHFWVPGSDNWGACRDALERAGGVYPELAIMLDLESARGKWDVRGDQSIGVLDFLQRAQDYLVNRDGVCLYINFNADPDLMPVNRIPAGLKLIVPRYAGPDKPPVVPPGVKVFAHQYASDENTPPFGPTDINQAFFPLSEFVALWGSNGGVVAPPPPVDPPVVVDPPPPPPVEVTDTSDSALLSAVVKQFD